MALQAFIDDSGGTDKNQHPYFVLGGFVSSEERWAEFSSDWQVVLDMEPRLEYFKMSEAGYLSKQFAMRKGWTKPLRDERLKRFVEVARSYPIFRTSVSIDKGAFYQHVASLKVRKPAPTAGDPYFLAFHKLVLGLPLLQAGNISSLAAEGRIDFIFDNQGVTGARASVAWENLKQNVLPKLEMNGVPNVLPFLGSPPIYRDEKEFLPLQAADLYAWHVRKHVRNNRVLAVSPTPHLSRLFEIPGNDMVYNRSELLDLRSDLIASIAQ